MLRRLLCLATLAGCLAPASADAFCGFYVGHAGAALVNRATTVVLMRDGTRTVLSMRNDYTGPPEDFAMVVPVPVILRPRDVSTLPHDVFDQIDALTAPRLVEYWEQDPCPESGQDPRYVVDGANTTSPAFGTVAYEGLADGRKHGVRVHARFQSGEYDVEILGARDSLGLAAWLRAHDYHMPPGAEAALRPYVQADMKFFVAKVAIDRVRRSSDGRLTLSPLRFHYDSPQFSLPVRLGLLNAAGPQDLIVHILASTRQQAANRPNLAIPTNLDVTPATRDAFPQFYAALFDRTLQAAPDAVVTEYAWNPGTCDPCPVPALDATAVATFGGDVLWGPQGDRSLPLEPDTAPTGAQPIPDDDTFRTTEVRANLQRGRRPRPDARPQPPRELVLTRLHLRQTPDGPGEDLVLQAAPGLAGGREHRSDDGALVPTTRGTYDAFQARYAIRHRWTGPRTCDSKRRGAWGGPPDGHKPPAPRLATDVAFVARDAALTTFLVDEVPPLSAIVTPPAAPPVTGRSTRCDLGAGETGLLALLLLCRRRRRAPAVATA